MRTLFGQGILAGLAAFSALGAMVAAPAVTYAGTQAEYGQQEAGQQAPGQEVGTQPQAPTGMAPGEEQKTGQMTERSFVKDATQVNLSEIELGRLAAQKATTPAVKQYGERMVRDHTEVQQQLAKIAEKDKFEVPTQLSAQHQQIVDKLSGLSGNEFERQYMQTMVTEHQKAVDQFQQAANQIEHEELKNWAARTTDILKQHLNQARQINEQLATGEARRAS